MPIGETSLILGMTWLKKANPQIKWDAFSLSFKEEPLVGKAGDAETKLPEEFQDFTKVFSEQAFQELLPHRELDC